jgi:hypothetical protein
VEAVKNTRNAAADKRRASIKKMVDAFLYIFFICAKILEKCKI